MKGKLALTETYPQCPSAAVTKGEEKFFHGKQHFCRTFDTQYYAL